MHGTTNIKLINPTSQRSSILSITQRRCQYLRLYSSH